MNNKQNFGRKGEEVAAQYLVAKGLTVLEKNWIVRHLEADLICLDDDVLVIVEVKSRTSDIPPNPGEGLTRTKCKNLIRLAGIYMEQNNHEKVRFDLIWIIWSGKSYEVRHQPDAFFSHDYLS